MVSELAKSLDGAVEQFRSPPLDAGPYRFVQADAMTVRVREGGRTVLSPASPSRLVSRWAWHLPMNLCR